MLDAPYLVLALASAALSWLLVPLVDRAGRRLGFLDAVRPDKIHQTPKVRCGGVAIFAAFLLTLGIGLLFAAMAHFGLNTEDIYERQNRFALSKIVPPQIVPLLGNIGFVSAKLLAVLSGATLLFLTGLADDRFNLRPLPKLFMQILSAVPLIAAGITIRGFVAEGPGLFGVIPGSIIAATITVCWIVLLTNAFNFIDNMDGLSAGVAAVCALNFYLVSRAGGEFFMMAMFALLAGSAVGFLRWNFARSGARLFMGDSGSLFLGYMLAALAIMVTYYQRGVSTQLPVVAPLIVLGVPIFDTASVMWIRWRAGKPLMQGDQNHFSHRLVALGFSRRQAVLFIYLVTFVVGLSAAYLRYLPWTGAIIALAQIILFFLIIWFLERVAREKRDK